MPNDFNVGNAVKQLIWTGVVSFAGYKFLNNKAQDVRFIHLSRRNGCRHEALRARGWYAAIATKGAHQLAVDFISGHPRSPGRLTSSMTSERTRSSSARKSLRSGSS